MEDVLIFAIMIISTISLIIYVNKELNSDYSAEKRAKKIPSKKEFLASLDIPEIEEKIRTIVRDEIQREERKKHG